MFLLLLFGLAFEFFFSFSFLILFFFSLFLKLILNLFLFLLSIVLMCIYEFQILFIKYMCTHSTYKNIFVFFFIFRKHTLINTYTRVNLNPKLCSKPYSKFSEFLSYVQRILVVVFLSNPTIKHFIMLSNGVTDVIVFLWFSVLIKTNFFYFKKGTFNCLQLQLNSSRNRTGVND